MPRMHRAESGCLNPGEEESVGKGREDGEGSVRAREGWRGRAAAGDAAKCPGPAAAPAQSLFPGSARVSRDLYGRGGTSAPSRSFPRPPLPSTLRCPVRAGLPGLLSRVSKPLAANRLSTREGDVPDSRPGRPGRRRDAAAWKAGSEAMCGGRFVVDKGPHASPGWPRTSAARVLDCSLVQSAPVASRTTRPGLLKLRSCFCEFAFRGATFSLHGDTGALGEARRDVSRLIRCLHE